MYRPPTARERPTGGDEPPEMGVHPRRIGLAASQPEAAPGSMPTFADAGGPEMFNFGNLLISRSFALGVRWKMGGGRGQAR